MNFFLFENSTMIVVTLSVAAATVFEYIHIVFKKWEREFPGNRLIRNNKSSPSNKHYPVITE